MQSLMVELGERSYPIMIGAGFGALEEAAWPYLEVMLVSDTNVGPLYADTVAGILQNKGIRVETYITRAGEQSKNLLETGAIYQNCIEKKLTRKSAIVALGGGVVGDLAGFAAATYLRGVDFIQIPTSLLAQVDSSVGGKVGIDFGGCKNMVGAFYQPQGVYINTDVLKTLPRRELSAGLAEVIKYGVIYDGDFFTWLEENLDDILKLDAAPVQEMIERCCAIKAAVVKADEKEQRLRMILNYGHTIGHAIETAAKFSLLHGECVALGMLAAMRLACGKGMFSDDPARLSFLLRRTGLPVSISGLDEAEILSALQSDKKSVGEKINFVLPVSYGTVEITREVVTQEIKDAIKGVVL